MAEDVKIPEPNQIVPLLPALIGKDMRVGDDGAPVMLAGGDASFACLSGAALALIPKGRAEDAIRGREPDPDLAESYREVMTVLTRVIKDTGETHVRLVPGSTPDLATLPEPRSGRAYGLDIDGYGPGTLNFWKL